MNIATQVPNAVESEFVNALNEEGVQILASKRRPRLEDPRWQLWPSAEEIATLLGIHVATGEMLRNADPGLYRYHQRSIVGYLASRGVFPFRINGAVIDVGMIDPAQPDLFACDDIRALHGQEKRIQRFAASKENLDWAAFAFSRR